MVLRLGLEDEIGSGTAVSVAKTGDILGRIVVQRSDQVVETADGSMMLGEAVVREAVQLLSAEPTSPLLKPRGGPGGPAAAILCDSPAYFVQAPIAMQEQSHDAGHSWLAH